MMLDEDLLLTMLALPFLGALVVATLPARARNAAVALAALVPVACCTCAALLYRSISQGTVLLEEVEWLPTLGLNLLLRLDGLAWIFSIVVLGIGVLVVLYARYYLSPDEPVTRFFALLLAFMGAMEGVVTAGNVIQLVVFWELTSLFSFMLIGYWNQNPSAREGARMALTVTASGGLCLLVGMIILGQIVGSYELDAILGSGEVVKNHGLYLPALLLILAGALTKSAQFPFHFWLPHAMAAPTPVSAYLHSATMVKAGVFLLIRLWPVLSGTDAWYLLVGGSGMATLLLGAYAAIYQHDLKGLLAYSTISHLGLITLLLGLGSPLAAVAAIFHTLNHATFKASLFMAVGIIDHEIGTRDMRKLSGLMRYMPITARLAMVAAAAMAGVPLLNGFLSKEMFLAEAIADSKNVSTQSNFLLPLLATVASACSVLYSLRFIHRTFFGPAPVALPREPHEPARWMRFPIELLVLTCLVVGIVPAATIGPYLAVAVSSALGEQTPDYSLAIWHGFSPALLLSVLALASGIGLYLVFGKRINANPRGAPPLLHRLRGRQIFEASMAWLSLSAGLLTRLLGTARLQMQLRLVVASTLLAGALVALRDPTLELLSRPTLAELYAVDPVFALAWLLAAGCAVCAAYQAKYHRLVAVALTGTAGLVSCVTFMWLSAPDLALTQLLVEVVTTVLLLLGLRWLPKRIEDMPEAPRNLRTGARRGTDLTIALLGGTSVAAVAYAVMTHTPVASISDYFVRNAYSGAGGRNVVNVLLVDFRGFDTLGEITVLGIVGLTVFALLRRFRPAKDTLEAPTQQRKQNAYDEEHTERQLGQTLSDYLLIPRVIMHWLFPAIVLLALFLFLRGHDLPGGGFAAGIAMAIAFILQYMAAGTRWVEARLRINPIIWIGSGLLLAALTGMGAWLFGLPFLTSWFAYAELPLLGKVPIATAVLFDLGVLALVVGATVLMLVALAHQSIRAPRATLVPRIPPATDAGQPGSPPPPSRESV